MGFVFVILIMSLLALPFVTIFIISKIFNWVWILWGILTGNSEVIHTIKKETCEGGRLKNETWSEWFERKFEEAIVGERYGPKYRRDLKRDGPPPWQRGNNQSHNSYYDDWPK